MKETAVSLWVGDVWSTAAHRLVLLSLLNRRAHNPQRKGMGARLHKRSDEKLWRRIMGARLQNI